MPSGPCPSGRACGRDEGWAVRGRGLGGAGSSAFRSLSAWKSLRQGRGAGGESERGERVQGVVLSGPSGRVCDRAEGRTVRGRGLRGEGSNAFRSLPVWKSLRQGRGAGGERERAEGVQGAAPSGPSGRV